MTVEAEMRSDGIGAQLMQWVGVSGFCEREAERLGCDLLRISMVLGKDRTHNFYNRNGYADDGLPSAPRI